MLEFIESKTGEPRSFIRIYEGDELLRDLVVCRNPEGELGVYDMVNERFLKFDNCVEIREGKGVVLYTKDEYENLKNASCMYIDTAPYQYIDTGVKPNI